MKPAIRSALADADIAAAVDFYLAESATVATRFIAALERAVRQIEAQPESGSPRYAHELDLPQLRFADNASDDVRVEARVRTLTADARWRALGGRGQEGGGEGDVVDEPARGDGVRGFAGGR